MPRWPLNPIIIYKRCQSWKTLYILEICKWATCSKKKQNILGWTKLRSCNRTDINEVSQNQWKLPDFDVTFANLNFRLKGFPVSEFQQCDGYTESQRLMWLHVKHQLVLITTRVVNCN